MELAPNNYWQVACEKLQQRIGYLMLSNQWSDCKFLVGSESSQVVIEAHKLILATASPTFEAMFFSELAERRSPIPILDIQPLTFKNMLSYIYSDKININSFDEAFNLYGAAHKYYLPHLEKACTKYIDTNLNIQYACQSYEFASLYNEEKLLDKCLQLISCSTKAVLDDKSFEDIQVSTLVKIFSLEKINCTELDLFKAVERYVKVHEKFMENSTNYNANGLDIKLDSPVCSISKDIVVVNGDNETKKNNSEAKTEEKGKELEKGTAPSPSLETNKSDVNTSECKVKPNIRAAIEKIRFLTLTSQEFATGPAKSNLLTESEVSAILLNIASSSVTDVQMPNGFSICRLKRTFQVPVNNQETSSQSTARRGY